MGIISDRMTAGKVMVVGSQTIAAAVVVDADEEAGTRHTNTMQAQVVFPTPP